MSSAEEYRRRAAGCILLAEETIDSAYRLTLMEMAQAWLRLAEQAEKNSQVDLRLQDPRTAGLRLDAVGRRSMAGG
ncbi:MAG: hypothetical protein ACJ8EJ_05890 [Xanthobacteraceae bacterium]